MRRAEAWFADEPFWIASQEGKHKRTTLRLALSFAPASCWLLAPKSLRFCSVTPHPAWLSLLGGVLTGQRSLSDGSYMMAYWAAYLPLGDSSTECWGVCLEPRSEGI